jgi:DnaK suppressor protein
MASTSILQPEVTRSAAPRYRGTARSLAAQLRAGQPRTTQSRTTPHGPGGLARRRTQLEARWRDRLEQVTALSLAYHEETDSARPASSAVSRRARQLGRQAVAERQALAEIEAALERIATGRYGWCEQCGRTIAAAVLAAAPQSRYCAACARGQAPARGTVRRRGRDREGLTA